MWVSCVTHSSCVLSKCTSFGCYYYTSETLSYGKREGTIIRGRVHLENQTQQLWYQGSKIQKGEGTKGEIKEYSFKVWFRSENDEAVNQVKAKLLKIVQSERSDSKDDVRPDKSQRFPIQYQLLYFVIAWLAT